jgi:hypothetical protein
VLFQEPVTLCRVGGAQNSKLVLERSGKGFERLFLVIYVKDSTSLIIEKMFHRLS